MPLLNITFSTETAKDLGLGPDGWKGKEAAKGGRHLPREDLGMASECSKRVLTPVIRKTVNRHFPHTEMLQKDEQNTWQGYGGLGSFIHCH